MMTDDADSVRDSDIGHIDSAAATDYTEFDEVDIELPDDRLREFLSLVENDEEVSGPGITSTARIARKIVEQTDEQGRIADDDELPEHELH
jgi:hypothetical protein